VEARSRISDLSGHACIKPFSIEELRVPADAALEQTDRIGCAVCYEKNGKFDVRFWHYKQRSWEIINRF
jgi:hypothetical protein